MTKPQPSAKRTKKAKATIVLGRNDRGFLRADFKDGNGEDCSIQESSACCIEGEDEGFYLWLGVNEPRVQTGPPWEAVPLPKNVLIGGRMHLRQSHVKELLPMLKHFARHGELPQTPKPQSRRRKP